MFTLFSGCIVIIANSVNLFVCIVLLDVNFLWGITQSYYVRLFNLLEPELFF